jgi:UDP-N-acetylmuramate--alanine ligase
MSAIALILATMGHRVTGTDVVATAVFPQLEAAGVAVEVVDAAALFGAGLAQDADVIAHSTAFPPAEADRTDAGARGALVVSRAGILSGICATRKTVAVSGTHGKTTTTAMLAGLLDAAGEAPSFLVGAAPAGGGPAARWTDDGWFVVEADESDGTFVELGAEVALVTNVDEDHLDHWGSLDNIEAAFDRFLAQATVRVVCIDDPRREQPAPEPRAHRLALAHGAISVGQCAEADVHITEVVVDRLRTTFRLHRAGDDLGVFEIAAPGRHNARNAAVALAAGLALGVDIDRCRTGLAEYRGVARRFEVVGEAAGVTVVDDYAHNPGKVGALLRTTREAGWDRVVAVFQPHRYSRTRDQWQDFGSALAAADLVVVTDVYGAGEQPIPGVTGKLLVDALLDEHPWHRVAWLPALADVTSFLRHELRPGDLCLTVGAGDVWRVGREVLEALAVGTGPVAAAAPGGS